MKRRWRTLLDLPTTGNLLEPRNLNTSYEREAERCAERQARYYNTSAHDLPTFRPYDWRNRYFLNTIAFSVGRTKEVLA